MQICTIERPGCTIIYWVWENHFLILVYSIGQVWPFWPTEWISISLSHCIVQTSMSDNDQYQLLLTAVDDEALQNDPNKLGQSLTTWRQSNQFPKVMCWNRSSCWMQRIEMIGVWVGGLNKWLWWLSESMSSAAGEKNRLRRVVKLVRCVWCHEIGPLRVVSWNWSFALHDAFKD